VDLSKIKMSRCKPIILATQVAEIRKIMVQSQPGQIVWETLSRKKSPSQKKAGKVAQGVGSNPSTTKKKEDCGPGQPVSKARPYL
jgi:hypothetical protein